MHMLFRTSLIAAAMSIALSGTALSQVAYNGTYAGVSATVNNPRCAAPQTPGPLTVANGTVRSATGFFTGTVDASGHVVYTQPGDTTAGTHVFNWNGKTNAGVQLPDGNYTLKIQAIGAGGGPVTPSIASIGAVQAVGVEDGTATFTVNGMAVPMSELVTVNPTLTQTN